MLLVFQLGRVNGSFPQLFLFSLDKQMIVTANRTYNDTLTLSLLSICTQLHAYFFISPCSLTCEAGKTSTDPEAVLNTCFIY